MKKFKPSDQALHILTDEIVMILEVLDVSKTLSYVMGYLIRRPNYEVVKVAHFELSERIV